LNSKLETYPEHRTPNSEHRTLAYSPTFTDHLTNPRNVGELADANAIAEETNPVCGDRLRLYLRIRHDTIETAQFLAYGCPPTLACGSALSEMLHGCSIEKAKLISRKDLVDAVGGLPSRKQHAAALALETLRSALNSQSL
jgi:nitrogen fixation NifU-like protein